MSTAYKVRILCESMQISSIVEGICMNSLRNYEVKKNPNVGFGKLTLGSNWHYSL